MYCVLNTNRREFPFQKYELVWGKSEEILHDNINIFWNLSGSNNISNWFRPFYFEENEIELTNIFRFLNIYVTHESLQNLHFFVCKVILRLTRQCYRLDNLITIAVMSSTIGESFSHRLLANLLIVFDASKVLQLLDFETKF